MCRKFTARSSVGSSCESSMIKAQLIYCASCIRIRRILNEAPWANYDLIVASILCGIGVYLFANPDMFSHYGHVYATLDRFGPPAGWGAVFVASGIASFVIAAWPERPPFVLRLLARMGSAFCLLSFALNNWGNTPPPVSTVTYSVLAAAAVWAVLRTRHG